ncbi:phytanoyl-CoA dioxygenase family protein [Parahaliea mediterranea]|uniref:phytanoyl-CoA dioxygenase family protein n=1 Tax=Parahaliea mediterranea TaxID=651086 RepID=UPI000E2FE74E|nr:phytanoyl-CoA dioxygenase family protein [Parahaliea mediterranea]
MSLEENGYTIVRNVLSAQDIELLRERIDHVLKLEKVLSKDPLQEHFPPYRFDNGVIHDVYQRFGFFRKYAELDPILDCVESALGRSFYMYDNTLLYKPRDKENEVPWHQDYMSRPKESQKLITWIAIDDATKENGCLKVIPGSHRAGFRDWYRVRGETHHDRLKLDSEEVGRAEYVELPAGDAIIFSNYLVHSSEQNMSNEPRRAFRIAYKGLDNAKVPRGVPILIRHHLEDYSRLDNLEQVGKWRAMIHRIGRRLQQI